MKKLFSLCSIALLLLTLLTACDPGTAPDDNDPVTVRVAAIQGPTGIGMVHLMDAAADETTENTYEFSTHSAPDAVGPLLINNSADIAALPTNVAASLYNKTNGGIRLLAVNTLGVLYMLENGTSVNSVQDLRGKTIYTTGQGANPEYVLNYVLKENGLNPGQDVTIQFVATNDELTTLLANGTATIAMVPQPAVSAVTTQKPEIRIALSMNDEWEKVAGEDNKLMMGCVAVRKEFLETHPEAVETFLKEYEASINKTTDVETTAALCEEFKIIPKAAIAKKAIPYCELTFVDGADMKAQINKYYSVLFEANPQAIGGALPKDDFYYVGE